MSTTKTRKASLPISPGVNGARAAKNGGSASNGKAFVPREALLTVEQWGAMPDTTPRYELIEGRLVQKMPTTTEHAWAAGELLFALKTWGQSQGWRFLPEGTGVKIDEFGGAVPDLVGFSPERKLNPKASYNEGPFLVAEVLSPKTRKRDRTRKKKGYARIGVQLYLIVDADARTVEVYRLQNGAYGEAETLASDAVWQPAELPGFDLEVARLWF